MVTISDVAPEIDQIAGETFWSFTTYEDLESFVALQHIALRVPSSRERQTIKPLSPLPGPSGLGVDPAVPAVMGHQVY